MEDDYCVCEVDGGELCGMCEKCIRVFFLENLNYETTLTTGG
jgi:hypothetical protein